MKYTDDVISSYCGSLIGSSSIDAFSIVGEATGPFTSPDQAREFQQKAWSKSDGKAQQAIFLGDLCASTDEAVLKANRITHIVNMCDKCPNKFPKLRYFTLLVPSEEEGFPEEPSQMILDNMPSILRFIGDAVSEGGNVLIHSTRGASRSFFAAAAYLMKTHHWSAKEASLHLMSIRTSVEPTDAVKNSLQTFEVSLMKP